MMSTSGRTEGEPCPELPPTTPGGSRFFLKVVILKSVFKTFYCRQKETLLPFPSPGPLAPSFWGWGLFPTSLSAGEDNRGEEPRLCQPWSSWQRGWDAGSGLGPSGAGHWDTEDTLGHPECRRPGSWLPGPLLGAAAGRNLHRDRVAVLRGTLLYTPLFSMFLPRGWQRRPAAAGGVAGTRCRCIESSPRVGCPCPNAREVPRWAFWG